MKDTWNPNKTIGIQISMNSDSVIDNYEVRAPPLEHITVIADYSQPLNKATQRMGRLRKNGQPGSPSAGSNRTGRRPMPHQDKGLIINCQDNPGPREVPNGSGDRITTPPTDNRAGEQAYNHITLMSSVLHNEACKRCKFIMRQEFQYRENTWELDKQGKRQYSVTDKTYKPSR